MINFSRREPCNRLIEGIERLMMRFRVLTEFFQICLRYWKIYRARINKWHSQIELAAFHCEIWKTFCSDCLHLVELSWGTIRFSEFWVWNESLKCLYGLLWWTYEYSSGRECGKSICDQGNVFVLSLCSFSNILHVQIFCLNSNGALLQMALRSCVHSLLRQGNDYYLIDMRLAHSLFLVFIKLTKPHNYGVSSQWE